MSAEQPTEYIELKRQELQHCREVADAIVADIIATVKGGAELEPCVQGSMKRALHISTVLDNILRGWQ